MLNPPRLPWKDKVWQDILRDSVKSTPELAELLELSNQDLPWINDNNFSLFVPRTFIRRMKPGNADDPLLRQIVPTQEELSNTDGFSSDPLAESKFTPFPSILKKYHGRLLVIASSACPVHCRYCFRRHFPYDEFRYDSLSKVIDYVGTDPSIREVILSGGDPLSLRDSALANFVKQLEQLDQVSLLRFHTRYPIMIPQRVTAGLLQLFSATRLRIVVVVHTNHANEIDTDVITACAALKHAGVELFNQSVLLKGINDTVESLTELSYRLFDAHVTPYYLHLLDRVQGAAHFDVDESLAVELFNELRSRLPGYLVPRLVREEPDKPAKSLVSAAHHSTQLNLVDIAESFR